MITQETMSRPAGPTPLAPKRDVRLVLCLSAQERERLTELARAAGHESLAAFIRARTLAPEVER